MDELYENLVDEEDGVFDDIQEYQKIVDYVVNKIGFNVKKDINTNYESKIPTAIFRGSATGCGAIIKNKLFLLLLNQR